MVEKRKDQQQKSAALRIAEALVSPEDNQLPDMSNISVRMAHPLTMLDSLTEQIEDYIKLIRARQYWQIAQWVKRQAREEQRQIVFAKSRMAKWEKLVKEEQTLPKPPEIPTTIIWTPEKQISELEKLYEELIGKEGSKGTDVLDIEDLFVSDFFKSYCHISRGREFKLADTLQMLADSEIQTRNPDNDVEKAPFRSQ